MPKAKKKQKAAAPEAPQPQDAPADALPQATTQDSFEAKRTVPAVKKLSNERKKERWQGCQDVASLALEEGAAPKLMASGAGEKLVVLLRDDSPSVRLAAARALLNLTHTGEVAQAEQIARGCPPQALKALLVASLAALKKAIDNPPAQQPRRQKAAPTLADAVETELAGAEMENDEAEVETPQLMGECAIETVQLIAAVAYNVEAVVCQMGADCELLQVLIDCVPMHNVYTKQTTLSIAAAELLLLLCDENPPALHAVSSGISQGHRDALQACVAGNAVSPPQMLTKVVLTGLYLQVQPHQAEQLLSFVFATVRDVRPHDSCERLLSMPTETEGQRALKQAASQHLLLHLKALKTCLELCVNLVCSAEPATDEEEDEEKFARTDIGRVLIRGNIGQVIGEKASELLGSCPSPQTETALRNPQQCSDELVQEQYSEVEGAAVVLLMNLLMVLPQDQVGSAPAVWAALQAVFARDAALLKSITNTTQAPASVDTSSTRNHTFSRERTEKAILNRLENLCSCLWTVLRKGWDIATEDGSADIAFIMNLIQFTEERRRNRVAVKSDELIVNVLRLCAEACPEGRQGGAQYCNLVKTVGQLCMDNLRASGLSVNVEAMHTLIDVFSDDQYDGVMKSLNMLRHLATFQGFLSDKLNILQSTGGEIPMDLEPRLDTVLSNLEPFIAYKQQRLGAAC